MYIFAFVKWCSGSVSSPWQVGQSHIRWSHWQAGKQRLMGPILYLRDFSHYSQRCNFLPHVPVDLSGEGGRMQDEEYTPHRQPVTCRSAGAWFLIFCITLHEHKLQCKCSRRSMLQVCKNCQHWKHTPICHMQHNTTLEALGLWSAVCSRDGHPNCLALQVPLEAFHIYIPFGPCLVLLLKVKDTLTSRA